jgi:hypothetical protein
LPASPVWCRRPKHGIDEAEQDKRGRPERIRLVHKIGLRVEMCRKVLLCGLPRISTGDKAPISAARGWPGLQRRSPG